MSLDQTILKIKRKFTKEEEYKLLLKQLMIAEESLERERKCVFQLKEEIKQLKNRLSAVKTPPSKFVTKKSFNKLQREKVEWEQRFWEIHGELEKLKKDVTPGES